ncbi:HEPN domain-containing protein [Glaciimonas soli]|uniref:HEPN domain-containing protein n=1 Tax=Glaciimonas soli TaxID=2590999 RepID=UPI001885126F|nr:HEPN domain-containing protein [Glaciimonas soli]
MNLDHVRTGVNARLAEARLMLGLLKIDGGPQSEVPKNDPTSATIRGMVYVSLYGALEYCVEQGVQGLLNFISASQVQNAHLEYSVNVVALDPFLTSVRDAGEKKKWPSRRALFEKMADSSVCTISNTAFGTFLHNVHPSTIEEVFHCFGIDLPPTPEPRQIGYLQEIVDKRNAVAHGRDTATEVGEGRTLADLVLRMDAVYAECIYFLSALEEHASDLSFVQPRYRGVYRSAA